MNFFKWKKQDTPKDLFQSNSKDKLKKKLEEIRLTTESLNSAVSATQNEIELLIDRIRFQMKSTKKTFSSLTDKLVVGVILLDHTGTITKINNKGKEILNLDDNYQLNHISDLIKSFKVDGNKLSISRRFFKHFSPDLIKTILEAKAKSEPVTCDICFDSMDRVFKSNESLLVDFETVTGLQSKMMFRFSVLDNDPDSEEDLVYLVVFRQLRS